MRVRGLNAAGVRALFEGPLKIESVEMLQAACAEGSLEKQKGFGKKTVARMASRLEFYLLHRDRLIFPDALILAEGIEGCLAQMEGKKSSQARAVWVRSGLLLRGAEVVDTLCWVWCVAGGMFQVDALALIDNVCRQIAGGIEEGSYKRIYASPYVVVASIGPFLPELAWYAARNEDKEQELLLSSSSPAHLQYGAEGEASSPTFFERLHQKSYPNLTEAYAEIGVGPLSPPFREGPYVFSHLKEEALAEVVNAEDLQGILHVHSTYSDGKHTLRELSEACQAKGYRYLGITDHSRSAFYAHGLEWPRVLLQHKEIDEINADMSPFRIFKGIEVDILSEGRLDYPSEMLSHFDFVIASVHSGLDMDEKKATERILAAIANPFTTFLGHWTGRLLCGRKGYPISEESLIAACATHEVAIEFNANPRRYEASWRWMGRIQAAGVKMAINPDAHSIAGLEDMQKGVMMAKKGLLKKQNVLNALSKDDIADFFRERKQRANALKD